MPEVNVPTKAMKMLVGYYKGNEFALARELVMKFGYTAKDLAKARKIHTEAARRYYKPVLSK